jgi:hypothetical protein
MKKKYNPMSKEFQEYAKRLGLTGNQLVKKYIDEGKLPNSTNVENKRMESFLLNNNYGNNIEYRDLIAQAKGLHNNAEYMRVMKPIWAKNIGYSSNAERVRDWYHKTGRKKPMSENKDCAAYFGIYIAENYIIKTFESSIRMPPNNPGYDWICKNGYKIQCEARCLKFDDDSDWLGWHYHIEFNNIADYFLLSAWDDRNNLNPLHIWVFHKNDIVRGNEFWNRISFSVTNNSEKLRELEIYEVIGKLDKLKQICKL